MRYKCMLELSTIHLRDTSGWLSMTFFCWFIDPCRHHETVWCPAMSRARLILKQKGNQQLESLHWWWSISTIHLLISWMRNLTISSTPVTMASPCETSKCVEYILRVSVSTQIGFCQQIPRWNLGWAGLRARLFSHTRPIWASWNWNDGHYTNWLWLT